MLLAVAAGEQQAYRLEALLRFFAPAGLPIEHFPDTETLPYDPFSPHQAILSQRLATLYRLPQQRHGVLIATFGTLLEKLPPRRWLDGRAMLLAAGDTLDLQAFRQRLAAAGYQAVAEVVQPGEFALRGALFDVFPMGGEQAFRIDLFDRQIESIRVFDPETQRSTDKVEAVRLLPAREFPTDAAGIEIFRRRYRETFSGDPSRSKIYGDVSRGVWPAGIEAWLPLFFESTGELADYLPEAALVTWFGDPEAHLETEWRQADERYQRLRGDLSRPLLPPSLLFADRHALLGRLRTHAQLRFGDDGETLPVQPLPGGETAVRERLRAPGDRVLLVAESAGRRQILNDWLRPQGLAARAARDWGEFLTQDNRYALCIGPLQEGLRLSAAGLTLIAEAQVFGLRAPAATRRRVASRDPEAVLRDLNDLAAGAPVVHVDHGVGRYRGLEKATAGGIEAEYLIIEYAGGDKLYVPVAALHQVHRYTGSEPESAPLHSLGSERWAKARAKAGEKAADVAAELLSIHARRAARPARALALDTEAYARFCEGFPFTTTPDQQATIDAVIADLGRAVPMDRVVCGDVGFGKTEVALRAAFATARAGFQTCLLAPTTLLAAQHEQSFVDRFAQYLESAPDARPIRVRGLSRLKNAGEQAALLQDLAAGRVDVVIGTHRLLQADVHFKNLGLVIVDEEHRFGVRHKERLKDLRADVHLLTLTATPIPRTLNMTLAGLRDLSIIATPPETRLPIRTFVTEWSPGLLQEAITRELRRGGQIYVLHNEVRNIQRFAQRVAEWVPEARIRIAHGQMRSRELEQVMLDFYHGRFDVLVCTTIIESGIDVPNANTMVIDRADAFGLAQLHQLRGRVGRSHHRAYAYLMVPSKSALSADAQRRLEAIEQFDELGAGFVLATHDLEIRGAGELLGEYQSGQIEEIGFTLYSQMLAEAVRSLRAGALPDTSFEKLRTAGCEIDLGVSALIPDGYVPDVHTRLSLYKRLAEVADTATLDDLMAETIDRFGALPEPADRLFDAARLRLSAQPLGIVRLRAGVESATLEFGAAPRVDPARLIALIQAQPKRYRLEAPHKLHLREALGQPAARVTRLAALLATLAGESVSQAA
ncbi:MAG: transcription-repair coupling factor [Gammaproteobacteria bacterium]|nr:transcription-repair coupling factor [Gammaproteobacteria bacterium]